MTLKFFVDTVVPFLMSAFAIIVNLMITNKESKSMLFKAAVQPIYILYALKANQSGFAVYNLFIFFISLYTFWKWRKDEQKT